MAQAGFPWYSPQTDSTAVSVPPHEHKHRNGSIHKKRHDSLKKGTAPRPHIRFQLESSQPREPAKRIPVRTIPPWIQDADEDDVQEATEAGLLLPHTPHGAVVAAHNHTPSTRESGYPVSSGGVRSEPTSRWISFARSSAYPRENFNSEKVSAEWLNENWTDYSKPWLADHEEGDDEDGSDKYRAFRRKRRAWYQRLHFAIMRNPFIPLVFRLVVITFAAIAMALGASIFHENNNISDCINYAPDARPPECVSLLGGKDDIDYSREDPSALMAIIVDAVAIVYSVYITYDEYFSKPLGLRKAGAKVRLVLLDLFFIVFQSANLSLAFNSITIDSGACKVKDGQGAFSPVFPKVCDTAKALSSVLLVSLVAWLLTFSVSILRYVQKIPATHEGTNISQACRINEHQIISRHGNYSFMIVLIVRRPKKGLSRRIPDLC